MNQSTELARQEGEEFRVTRLTVSSEGLILKAVDAGPAVESTWVRDEYEFCVGAKESDLLALAFALLREKFAGKLDAVEQFREFCERNGIEHRFDTWT